MSATPAPCLPPDAASGDAALARPYAEAALHRHILSRLAEYGLEIAGDLKAQIHDLTPPPPRPDAPPPHPLDRLDMPASLAMARASADLGLAFARVSRAVRLSIALADRLAREEVAPPPAVPTARPARTSRPNAFPHEGPDDAYAETPVHAWREHLVEREAPEGLIDRPIGDLIAQICADLGLEPDWPALAAAAWTRARASTRTSPDDAPTSATPPSSPGALAPPEEVRGEARGGVYRASG